MTESSLPGEAAVPSPDQWSRAELLKIVGWGIAAVVVFGGWLITGVEPDPSKGGRFDFLDESKRPRSIGFCLGTLAVVGGWALVVHRVSTNVHGLSESLCRSTRRLAWGVAVLAMLVAIGVCSDNAVARWISPPKATPVETPSPEKTSGD